MNEPITDYSATVAAGMAAYHAGLNAVPPHWYTAEERQAYQHGWLAAWRKAS